ncbi:NlpC/P60 family protein [Streptosporangium sp. NPDC004379]|uniref:C40 family peptidase n=1 Tax=Streptosporangium sp. NPDC004379 TaxID=3366189 RepID=UPI0036D09060
MKRTPRRGSGRPAGPVPMRERASRRLSGRTASIGLAFTLLAVGAPMTSAGADPKPDLRQLAKQVEKLHVEVETLAEQYNGARVKLKQAQRAAEVAKKNLSTSETELESRRTKATLLAQSTYMSGGLGSTLAFTQSSDPDTFLDQAATSYALQQRQSEEVAQVAQALKVAEQARASASARSTEVKKLLGELGDKRSKIERLVGKLEGNLYREVRDRAQSMQGRATRLTVPVVGQGKAAEAVRWALTQQLKPYVWGAEGPNSFDCSGLVLWAYQKVGISLPHYTGDQWTAGTHVSRDQLRPGDLVFFYSDLHHVGIYLGAGLMIHAPQTGDVVRIAPMGNRPFAGGVRVAD